MKKIICLVLAAIMIFALVACNATQGSDIDELKQRITQLEDKNKELEDELHNQKLKYEDKLTQQERKYDDKLSEQKSEYENKLDSQKSEYEDKLNEQSEKIEDMQKDIDYLEQKTNGITGTFYKLEEAYDNGWLTREELMHISYFKYGHVEAETQEGSGKWNYVKFEPKIPKPILRQKTEMDIKEAYYKAHKDDFSDTGWNDTEALDCIMVNFYGEYNDSYVVEIRVLTFGYFDHYDPRAIGGIVFNIYGPPFIEVFKFI